MSTGTSTTGQSLALLLQISDSAYPTGAFAHSNGLEGLIDLELVQSLADVVQFLETRVSTSLTRVDLPLLRLAYEATLRDDSAELRGLDEFSAALKMPLELRSAAQRVGSQRLDLIENIFQLSTEDERRYEQIRDHLPKTQSNVVAGVEAALGGIPLQDASVAAVCQTFAAILAAALKLLRLGQTQVQSAQYDLFSRAGSIYQNSQVITRDQIGWWDPVWDIASARHERSEHRLFIS